MAMYEIYQDYPVSRDCEQSEKKPGSVKKKVELICEWPDRLISNLTAE